MARVWSWRLLALLPFATDTLGQSRHYNARQRFQTKEVEDPVQAPPDYRTKTDDFFMEVQPIVLDLFPEAPSLCVSTKT